MPLMEIKNKDKVFGEISEHSGHLLPRDWRILSERDKVGAISRLRRQMFVLGTYKEPLRLAYFDNMHYSDRWAVINHLIKSEALKPMGPLPAPSPANHRDKLIDCFMATNEIMSDLPFSPSNLRTFAHCPNQFRGPLHDKPNGGKRILRSAYGRLKTYWLRASGQLQEIHEMNDGHLSNTLDLLQESHGNLIARSQYLLGKMHMHFQNQPHILQLLEDACKMMDQVEVDELYPIWKELAREKAVRMQEPNDPIGVSLNLWADDDLNIVD